jgi:hypothetical protein
LADACGLTPDLYVNGFPNWGAIDTLLAEGKRNMKDFRDSNNQQEPCSGVCRFVSPVLISVPALFGIHASCHICSTAVRFTKTIVEPCCCCGYCG